MSAYLISRMLIEHQSLQVRRGRRRLGRAAGQPDGGRARAASLCGSSVWVRGRGPRPPPCLWAPRPDLRELRRCQWFAAIWWVESWDLSLDDGAAAGPPWSGRGHGESTTARNGAVPISQPGPNEDAAGYPALTLVPYQRDSRCFLVWYPYRPRPRLRLADPKIQKNFKIFYQIKSYDIYMQY
jgi:hypothetical protein